MGSSILALALNGSWLRSKQTTLPRFLCNSLEGDWKKGEGKSLLICFCQHLTGTEGSSSRMSAGLFRAEPPGGGCWHAGARGPNSGSHPGSTSSCCGAASAKQAPISGSGSSLNLSHPFVFLFSQCLCNQFYVLSPYVLENQSDFFSRHKKGNTFISTNLNNSSVRKNFKYFSPFKSTITENRKKKKTLCLTNSI